MEGINNFEFSPNERIHPEGENFLINAWILPLANLDFILKSVSSVYNDGHTVTIMEFRGNSSNTIKWGLIRSTLRRKIDEVCMKVYTRDISSIYPVFQLKENILFVFYTYQSV